MPRLIELQRESDSLAACAAAGRQVRDPNLRGWAALLPPRPALLQEGLRQSGIPVLRGEKGALALGSISQLWSAARSLADAVEDGGARALATELARRAGNVEAPEQPWLLPRSRLPEGRVLVMAVLNVTPDSFSDGGSFAVADAAVEHGLRLAAEGADLIDVGGESTRPGAQPVPADEELRRALPVIRELVRRAKVPISIDTTKAEVARAAVEAGAEVVNDVSGLRRDPEMGTAVARGGAALCLMHSRGEPRDMQQHAAYADLLGEMQDELLEGLRRAREAGVPEERIALDPGLGFAKTAEHNLLLMRRLRELTQLGRPLLAGASRKSFLGRLSGKIAPERLTGSVAAAAVLALNGASILRVHDVAATREALAVVDAVRSSAS
ncbi:MAG TPA: dihydropteroate synthase [Myxococcales bacterium]|nr:dihydropteroate synthase [Myxococcales bacterium]